MPTGSTTRVHQRSTEIRGYLSYPAVSTADDEVFMIPESSFDGTVRLYRASAFPTVW
jgi:hypothetical protein